MITIDGSAGEGGGQIIRTSLALSLITGKSFAIDNVRAGRKRPGLLRQHLTAVNAASAIGNAIVEGNQLGSRSFTFVPEQVAAGEYHFDIGSAGSCTLVLQTVLPALMIADGPSQLTLVGGTHNPHAPPFDFLVDAFLPILGRFGPRVEVELERPGFYPGGGGRMRASILPCNTLSIIELTDRGVVVGKSTRALVSNLPLSIARREINVVRNALHLKKSAAKAIEIDNAHGPGNVLFVSVECENVTELFTGFGERGVRAETVANRTVTEVNRYLDSEAAVGSYLADQLLIPFAMSGEGRFTTLAPTQHTLTNIEVIKRFLDVDFTSTQLNSTLWSVQTTLL